MIRKGDRTSRQPPLAQRTGTKEYLVVAEIPPSIVRKKFLSCGFHLACRDLRRPPSMTCASAGQPLLKFVNKTQFWKGGTFVDDQLYWRPISRHPFTILSSG